MTNSLNVTKLRYDHYELLQKHQVDNIIEVRFLLMTISLSFTTFLKLSIIFMQILITFKLIHVAWTPYDLTWFRRQKPYQSYSVNRSDNRKSF